MALLCLQACDTRRKIYVSEELRTYEIVAINRPKHFSVDLLDVETHQLFKGEGRSKRCNNWRQNSLHDLLKVNTIYYKYEGSEDLYIELADTNDYLCRRN